MGALMNGWVDGWKSRQVGGYMNGWIDRQMDEGMITCVYAGIYL